MSDEHDEIFADAIGQLMQEDNARLRARVAELEADSGRRARRVAYWAIILTRGDRTIQEVLDMAEDEEARMTESSRAAFHHYRDTEDGEAITDAPEIERPPLEAYIVTINDGDDIATTQDGAQVIVRDVSLYAIALEAKLARYERYRERTKDFWHMTAFGIELSSDDIAKEEGIE